MALPLNRHCTSRFLIHLCFILFTRLCFTGSMFGFRVGKSAYKHLGICLTNDTFPLLYISRPL